MEMSNNVHCWVVEGGPVPKLGRMCLELDGSLDTKGCELKIFIHPGPGWGHLTAYSQRKD